MKASPWDFPARKSTDNTPQDSPHAYESLDQNAPSGSPCRQIFRIASSDASHSARCACRRSPNHAIKKSVPEHKKKASRTITPVVVPKRGPNTGLSFSEPEKATRAADRRKHAGADLRSEELRPAFLADALLEFGSIRFSPVLRCRLEQLLERLRHHLDLPGGFGASWWPLSR